MDWGKVVETVAIALPGTLAGAVALYRQYKKDLADDAQSKFLAEKSKAEKTKTVAEAADVVADSAVDLVQRIRAELTQSIDDLKKSLSQKNDEIICLSAELAQLRIEKNTLAQHVLKMEQERNGYETRLAELYTGIESLRIANVRYEKQIQALRAEMVKLQEERDYWRNMAEAPAK